MVNMSWDWSIWRLLGWWPQKPKSLSSSVYEMFLFNDHFRPTLDKLKFIDELSISWQDLIKMASHRHTHPLLGVMSDVHRLSTLICHTCQFFPQSMVHDQFFRSKVDCPYFEFSRRMLCAHLCEDGKLCFSIWQAAPSLFCGVITVSGADKQAAFSMAFHWHIKWYHATALWSVNYSEGNQYGPDLSRWTDFTLFFTWKHSMKWQRPTARWILDKRSVSVPN